MAALPPVNEASPVGTLTAAQADVIARALADAEHYRRDSAAMWCADCGATPGEACPCRLAYVAPANAYRQLAAELALITKSAGRDVRASRPASEPLPLPRERSLP
jgi:hypothetical protein